MAPLILMLYISLLWYKIREKGRRNFAELNEKEKGFY